MNVKAYLCNAMAGSFFMREKVFFPHWCSYFLPSACFYFLYIISVIFFNMFFFFFFFFFFFMETCLCMSKGHKKVAMYIK